jgi:hypothetical protein
MLGALEVRFAVRIRFAFLVIRNYDCTTTIEASPSLRYNNASGVTFKTYYDVGRVGGGVLLVRNGGEATLIDTGTRFAIGTNPLWKASLYLKLRIEQEE